MVAKTLQLSVFLLLQVHFLFSQCINVELLITWEKGYDIFQKDSLVDIPKLNIIYRNNCDTNYFFYKVSPKSNRRPMVICLSMIQYIDDDYRKRAESHGKYTNQNFNVIIGGPWFDAHWNVSSDTANYHRKYSVEPVECSLQEIYQYLYRDYRDEEIEKLLYFVPSKVTPENIIASDQFVFLKRGETHIDTYNLIGFKLVEGCYTFIIEQDRIEDCILFIQDTVQLPAIVGEYQLYSGRFSKNKVTVCFGER